MHMLHSGNAKLTHLLGLIYTGSTPKCQIENDEFVFNLPVGLGPSFISAFFFRPFSAWRHSFAGPVSSMWHADAVEGGKAPLEFAHDRDCRHP